MLFQGLGILSSMLTTTMQLSFCTYVTLGFDPKNFSLLQKTDELRRGQIWELLGFACVSCAHNTIQASHS
jgi:hypothetical protein